MGVSYPKNRRLLIPPLLEKEYGEKMEFTYTYWREGDWYVGCFDDFPDCETQGKTIEELERMLKALYLDLRLNERETAYGKGKLALA
jgi:predicted RNase H-like HicB family nuclease